MKAFLQEYGIILVVVIIMLALIGVAVFLRHPGPETMKGYLNNFVEESQKEGTMS